MFGTATAIFLNTVARDGGDVVVVLFELFCWFLRSFFFFKKKNFSSTTAIDSADFPVRIAIEALLFGRVFEKFEDPVLFMSAIKSCGSLLNLLIFCVWLKS